MDWLYDALTYEVTLSGFPAMVLYLLVIVGIPAFLIFIVVDMLADMRWNREYRHDDPCSRASTGDPSSPTP